MLGEMSLRQFEEWRVFAGLEPFGEDRADVRNALIAALLANAHRDTAQAPQPFGIEEFLMRFADHDADLAKRQFEQAWAAEARYAFERGRPLPEISVAIDDAVEIPE